MRIVTPQQMRTIEDNSEKYGVSKKVLMENAGHNLAFEIDMYCIRISRESDRKRTERNVVFLAGSGNNGGDCFVSARLLAERSFRNITVILFGNPKTELAKEMFARIPSVSVRITDINDKNLKSYIESADVLVAGVFGTGFHGVLDKSIADIFSIGTKAYKIAVDVPSGADCRTGGVADGTFRADRTLALGCLKTGMTQYPLREYCGKINVMDINIPEKAFCLSEDERIYSLVGYGTHPVIKHYGNDITFINNNYVLNNDTNKNRPVFKGQPDNFPPVRRADSHKGDFGKVLIIAGSSSMRGAGALSVLGALKSGAGLVRLMSAEKCIDTVSVLAPEATFAEIRCNNKGFMLFDSETLSAEMKRADVVVIGCGMGVTDDTRKMTEFVVENAEIPVIIDADGINCIASDIDILLKKKTDIIITPHVGEMARLVKKPVSEINGNRFETAESLAEKYNITVVLKGAGTVIADNKRTSVNCTGNPGMSRGGSGDFLCGII